MLFSTDLWGLWSKIGPTFSVFKAHLFFLGLFCLFSRFLIDGISLGWFLDFFPVGSVKIRKWSKIRLVGVSEKQSRHERLYCTSVQVSINWYPTSSSPFPLEGSWNASATSSYQSRFFFFVKWACHNLSPLTTENICLHSPMNWIYMGPLKNGLYDSWGWKYGFQCSGKIKELQPAAFSKLIDVLHFKIKILKFQFHRWEFDQE